MQNQLYSVLYLGYELIFITLLLNITIGFVMLRDK